MTEEHLRLITRQMGVDMDIFYDKRDIGCVRLRPRQYCISRSKEQKTAFSNHPIIQALQYNEDEAFKTIRKELPLLLGDTIGGVKVRYIDARGYSIPAISCFNKHGDLIICGGEADMLIVAATWNNLRCTLWENVLAAIELKKTRRKNGDESQPSKTKTRTQSYAQSLAIGDHSKGGRDRYLTMVLDRSSCVTIIVHGYRTLGDQHARKKSFYSIQLNNFKAIKDYVVAHMEGRKIPRRSSASRYND